jgi:hypothetical protein
MAYTQSAVTPHEFTDPRSATQPKRHWFRRFIAALQEANMRRVEREYGRYAHLVGTPLEEDGRARSRRLNSTR